MYYELSERNWITDLAFSENIFDGNFDDVYT